MENNEFKKEYSILCIYNRGKPFILETPNDDAGYAEEIKWVRSIMNR